VWLLGHCFSVPRVFCVVARELLCCCEGVLGGC